MKFFSHLLVASALICPALAESMMGAWLWEDPRDGFPYGNVVRLWVGDGKLYAGLTIPRNIKSAYNFTLADRAPFFYVHTDLENNPLSAPPVPEPSFLVANIAPGAKDPILVAHSYANLTDDNSAYWTGNYVGRYTPMYSGGKGAMYLVPVLGTPGTYTLRWVVDQSDATVMGGVRADLAISDQFRGLLTFPGA